MTAPRWIVEALEASFGSPDAVGRLDIGATATALIGRLPIEEMAKAGHLAVLEFRPDSPTGAALGMVTAIVGVLADGDPEVVTLAELYHGACKVLDEAGVPYAVDGGDPAIAHSQPDQRLDLAGRIRWLAQQRPTRIQFEAERAALRLVVAERDAALQVGADLASERGRLRNELAAERSALKQVGEARELYRTERDAARERISALEGETEVLTVARDAAASEAEHNERELVELRRRFDDLQRDRDSLARDLNRLQGDLDTSERKLRDAERDLQRHRHPGGY